MNQRSGIFLIEDIIAEFLKKIVAIEDKTWWMYVAKHSSSGLRIVAGFGGGVVLSRFLEFETDISREVSKTLVYLKRFGLKDEIKIVTPLSEIESAVKIDFETICNRFNLKIHKDIESILVEFASRHRTIRKMFTKCMDFSYFDKKKICTLLYAILFSLLIIFSLLYKNILQEDVLIHELKKDEKIISDDMKLSINIKNLSSMSQFISKLTDTKYPIEILKELSDICKKYQIKVEQLSLQNCSFIKIKTFINREKLKKIRKLSNKKMEITVENLMNSNDAYEDIGAADKNFGVVICVKIK